ncbi:MAG TPA: CPBP family glutamic-type intramembrane protease [Phototrophicaceae bacterium]|nr:CPBP family glutamic-type intramembrane protease [Phototrophicaceae bacterium]
MSSVPPDELQPSELQPQSDQPQPLSSNETGDNGPTPARKGIPVVETEIETPLETRSNSDVDDGDDEYEPGQVRYRGATNDPVFGFLIALALSIGLSPLIASSSAELRYTLAWGVLAVFGVLAWLFGNTARIGQETLDNAIWGGSFGLILGAPLLAFGGGTLTTAVGMLFGTMNVGTLLAYLVFVMPLAETLFFRGILQEQRPFWVVGLMGSLWSVVLFFPMMDLRRFPVVAFVICLTLVMMNVMYSYVRERNGLAAAWICQIVVNLVLVLLPFLGRG